MKDEATLAMVAAAVVRIETKTDEIRSLVDGSMTTLKAELAIANSHVAGLVAVVQTLKLQRESDGRTSDMRAVIITDGEGRILEWNPAATILFGYMRDSAIGALVSDLLIAPETRAKYLTEMKRVPGQADETKTHNFRAMRSDGQKIEILAQFRSWMAGDKRGYGLMAWSPWTMERTTDDQM